MPGVKDLDIVFGNPHKAYRAGDNVTGACVFTVADQPLTVFGLSLKFSGKSMVGFTRDGGKHRRRYWSDERYVDRTVEALQSESGMGATLEPGRHEFPFVFQLDSCIPSSFEGVYGGVRYSVKATLNPVGSKNVSVKCFYSVFRPLDLNESLSALNPREAEDEKTLCCMCCAYGALSARAWVDKGGYVPGESIRLYGNIRNDSNTAVSKTYFTIERETSFRAMGETEKDIKELKLRCPSAVRPPIPAGSTDTWSGEHTLEVPLTVPSYMFGCSLISVDYYVVLNVIPRGPGMRLKVRVPIIIGTDPVENRVESNQPQSNDPTGGASAEEHCDNLAVSMV